MTEEYNSNLKEDLELIARLEREEIQDIVREELEKERDKQEKARTLTEQQELQLARVANHALAVTNCLKAITSFKGLIALVFIFVSLIIILTAGWWIYISGRCDDLAESQYNKYKEQLKENGATWAMTKIGKEAQALDQAGILQDLIHCQLKGFVKVKGKDGKNYCHSEKRGASFEVLPN